MDYLISECKRLIKKFVSADITVSEYRLLCSSFDKLCSYTSKYEELLSLLTLSED